MPRREEGTYICKPRRGIGGFSKLSRGDGTDTRRVGHLPLFLGRAVQILDTAVVVELERLKNVAREADTDAAGDRRGVPDIVDLASCGVCQRQDALDLATARVARNNITLPLSIGVWSAGCGGTVDDANASVTVATSVARDDV